MAMWGRLGSVNQSLVEVNTADAKQTINLILKEANMIIRFKSDMLGELWMRVSDDKLLEQLEALTTLGWEPRVEIEDN